MAAGNKSLIVLQAMHKMKDEIGLVTLAPDVAERVHAELGWIEGIDFLPRPAPPIERNYLRVSTRKTV